MIKVNRYSCYKLDGMCLDAAGSWCSYAEADKRYRELQAQLANVKIEVANRVARGDFIRYQHLQAILEDKP